MRVNSEFVRLKNDNQPGILPVGFLYTCAQFQSSKSRNTAFSGYPLAACFILGTLTKTRSSSSRDRANAGGMSHPCPRRREVEKEGQRGRGREGNKVGGEMWEGRDGRVLCHCHPSRNSEGRKQVCME